MNSTTLKAAKAYAASVGHKGNHGGWISSSTSSICQGWASYSIVKAQKIKDFMTAQVTAFDTFEQLVNTDSRYCPTIIPRTWREQFVADAFDRYMAAHNSPRRAWRGSGDN